MHWQKELRFAPGALVAPGPHDLASVGRRWLVAADDDDDVASESMSDVAEKSPPWPPDIMVLSASPCSTWTSSALYPMTRNPRVSALTGQ
eukprot:1663610-Rhodomonas_salina.3